MKSHMKNVVFLVLFVVTTACSKGYKFFSNETGDIKFTVVTDYNKATRYIMDGWRITIPDTNYVLISIREIDRLGDGIWCCFKKGDFEWEVCVHGAIVIEDKLNPSKFVFMDSLKSRYPNYYIHDESDYRTSENCFVYGFESGNTYTHKNNED